MSDPYLDFTDKMDSSDIQVNVFRVKKNKPPLHSECFIFNPKDKNKPSLPNIKRKPKIVKIVKIYFTLSHLHLSFLLQNNEN